MGKGRGKKEEEDPRPFVLRAFLHNLNFISAQFRRLSCFRSGDELKDPWDVYTRWLAHSNQTYESEVLAGRDQPKLSINDLYKAKDCNEFWRCANPYIELTLVWEFRFSEKAFRKYVTMPIPTKEVLMTWLLELAKGNSLGWDRRALIREGPCRQMVAFSNIISGGSRVLWLIQLHRIPKVRSGVVVAYDFFPHIYVLDIVKQNSSMIDLLEMYRRNTCGDADKWLMPEGTVEELRDQGNVCFDNSVLYSNKRFLPLKPPAQAVPYKDAQHLVLIGTRWVKEEQKSATSADGKNSANLPSIETYLTQVNSEALAQLADAESCKGFIRLLETIPNFRIRLTDQEREVIGTPGSVLVIGRSGTGKTTCAMLRLFASEVLFKYRSQIERSKDVKLLNTRFEAEDLDSRCGLHIVFVTASPVLTNEVKRYYWRLNDHIREELKRRNELRMKRREEEQQDYDIIEDDAGELELRRQASSEKDEIKLQAADPSDPAEDEEDLTSAVTQHSLSFMTESDFPFFATVRRLVLMVDATLRTPFFARNEKGAILGMNAGAEWHNELKGVLMINKEYKRTGNSQEAEASSSSESDVDEEVEETEKQDKPTKGKIEKKLSFEVDYHYFLRYFYSKVAQRTSCGPLTLWTEIVAYIKGSAESHKHPGWYLPKSVYLGLGRKTSFLRNDEKAAVWDIFIEYQRWKGNLGAYDFQDVVNHQLYFTALHGYMGVPIHYMMIDEVQDLTHATLLLLGRITEQSLFFSGDTAQTIAKGVGFRFCDLRSLFHGDSGLSLPVPQVQQLTINFRSHGKILDLANSVVSLLEAMFPRTIDKMAKEKSVVEGPTPMILNSQSVEELFLLLFGGNKGPSAPNLLSRAPIEFGCDQVIIVRTQEDKDRLPGVLKAALCLTVYESKGLEFDDVVLYDFFTNSEVPEHQWRILEQLTIVEGVSERVTHDFESLETSPLGVKLDNPHFEEAKFSLLCTELKMLYVAITRPRKRLIIFDTDTALREYIFQYWRKLNAVDVLQVRTGEHRVDIVNATSGQEVVESIAEGTGAEAWKEQGMKMMRHRFYDQAVKCFEYCGDAKLKEKAMCYSLANEAAEAIAKVQQTIEMKKFQQEPLLRTERRQMKQIKQESAEKFKRAGGDFERLGLLKQAAKCYFSAKENLKAAVLFEASEAWGQCAEALCAAELWSKAGSMFAKAGDYLRAIEAYRKAKAWDEILECIHSFADVMSQKERESLIKKYIPIALEDLMPKVVNVEDEDRIYLTEVEKEEAKAVIAEEDSDDEESEEELPAQKETPQAPDLASVQDPPSEQPEDVHAADSSILSISSSVNASDLLISALPIAQSTNPFAASSNPFEAQTDEVKSVVSDSDSAYSVVSAESHTASVASIQLIDTEAKLDVLSQYDPNDEWLQLETGSIATSLDSAVQKDGSVSFDYSIFDNSQAVALNLGGHLIKTKAEIFVEDEIMRKLLRYISMFSADVKTHLLSLRSADSLSLAHSLQPDWRVANIIDLDEVDETLICLVLDTLEYFQLYKLCLVVCNRYLLADRIGRYVTSLAHKYATLPDVPALLNSKTIALQKEKSVIAFTALHNVFEMISPEVLAAKDPHSAKSLGIRCFQSLLLLGYWKKCVYLLDRANALAITTTFADYKNYRLLYCAQTEEAACFSWLRSPEDCDAAIMAIDEANSLLNHTYAITLKVPRKENAEWPVFPQWAEFVESFWAFCKERTSDTTANLKRHVVAGCYLLERVAHARSFSSPLIAVRIHDCCAFFTLLLYATRVLPPVKELLDALSVEHFDMLLHAVNACEVLLSMRTNADGFSVYHMPIVYALLAPLGVREVKPSDITACLLQATHVVVARNSLITASSGWKIVPIDMEGDFFLCPIEIVCKAVALELLHSVADIVNSRYRHFQLAQPTLQFDAIESLSPAHSTLKNAACLFGEFAYMSELQSRYPEKLPNLLRGLKLVDEGDNESEMETLRHDLDKVLYAGADDQASMRFVRSANAVIVDKLEKRIAELKKSKESAGDVARFAVLFNVVVKGMEWVMDSPPQVTATARNYLLIYAHNLVRSIRYDVPSDHTMKMLAVSRVYILCRSELLLLDVIRIKSHPVLVGEWNRKQAKVTNRFLDDLAWLDVQVYYRYGDWAEAGRTLLRFLDCEAGNLPVFDKIGLIEKAALLGVIAGAEQPLIPDYYSQRFPPSRPIYKTDVSSLLASVLTWLNTLSLDISHAYAMPGDDPMYRHITKAAITLIATVLFNAQEPDAKVLTAFESLRSTLERYLRDCKDPFFTRLMALRKRKDIAALRSDVNRIHSKMVYGGFAVFACAHTVAQTDLDQALESALLQETRQKSCLATLDSKVTFHALKRKARVGSLRLKQQPQVVQPLERLSLTRLCPSLPAASASPQVFSFWRANRALMRLYPVISNYYIALLAHNQLATFTNVLDRHHVLNELFAVAEVYASLQAKLRASLDKTDPGLAKFVSSAESDVNDRLKAFEEWKLVISSSKKLDPTSKRKRKWDAQWKARLASSTVDTGKKRQDYLEKRARLLKRTGRS